MAVWREVPLLETGLDKRSEAHASLRFLLRTIEDELRSRDTEMRAEVPRQVIDPDVGPRWVIYREPGAPILVRNRSTDFLSIASPGRTP